MRHIVTHWRNPIVQRVTPLNTKRDVKELTAFCRLTGRSCTVFDRLTGETTYTTEEAAIPDAGTDSPHHGG